MILVHTEQFIKLASWLTRSDVYTERCTNFANDSGHVFVLFRVIEVNPQERCLDLNSWVSDATYLDRIHFPGISDVLVDNGPFTSSEWCLITASDDTWPHEC